MNKNKNKKLQRNLSIAVLATMMIVTISTAGFVTRRENNIFEMATYENSYVTGTQKTLSEPTEVVIDDNPYDQIWTAKEGGSTEGINVNPSEPNNNNEFQKLIIETSSDDVDTNDFSGYINYEYSYDRNKSFNMDIDKYDPFYFTTNIQTTTYQMTDWGFALQRVDRNGNTWGNKNYWKADNAYSHSIDELRQVLTFSTSRYMFDLEEDNNKWAHTSFWAALYDPETNYDPTASFNLADWDLSAIQISFFIDVTGGNLEDRTETIFYNFLPPTPAFTQAEPKQLFEVKMNETNPENVDITYGAEQSQEVAEELLYLPNNFYTEVLVDKNKTGEFEVIDGSSFEGETNTISIPWNDEYTEYDVKLRTKYHASYDNSVENNSTIELDDNDFMVETEFNVGRSIKKIDFNIANTEITMQEDNINTESIIFEMSYNDILMKPWQNTLYAKEVNGDEETRLTVDVLEGTSDDSKRTFKISGLTPGTVYDGATDNYVSLSFSSSFRSEKKLDRFQTKEKVPFVLEDEYISISSKNSDHIDIAISFDYDEAYLDFDPNTLVARTNEKDLDVKFIEGTETNRFIDKAGTEQLKYSFEIWGLDPETTYNSENPVQISIDGTNWINIEEFSTPSADFEIPVRQLTYILIAILALLIILIAMITRKKIKIKSAIWVDKDSVIVTLNKEKLIEKKKDLLSISNFEGEFEEKIEFSFIEKPEDSKEKGSKILIKNLGKKTYKDLSFLIEANTKNEEISKPWRKIHGKIEPFEKTQKRENILANSKEISDIDLEQVYGVGPITKEHFVKFDLTDIDRIIKLDLNSNKNEEFIETFPGLRNESFDFKKSKLKNIQKELKYLKKEINKK